MTPPLNGHDDHPAPPSPLGHVEEWESLAIDYLEARLSPAGSSAIANHLAACRSCRERLAEQKGMMLLLGAVEPVEVPRDLESLVFERLSPAPALLPLAHAAEPGILRRLLTGAARRPWVPAAIAVVVVLVALAGSGDVIRSRGGGDTARSGLGAETVATAAATATTAGAQSEALNSPPASSGGAALPPADARDNAGNAVATSDLSGTTSTVAGTTPTTAPQTVTGAQGSADTTATTVATVPTAVLGGTGPEPGAARTSAPTVWVSVDSAAGDANAGATIEEVTGLRPLAMQAAPGVPIYAAMIRRGSIDAVLRALGNAGLAATFSDAPRAPLDSAVVEGVREISALPYLEPVSPQGDTLSEKTSGQAVDAEADYVLIVLSAAR